MFPPSPRTVRWLLAASGLLAGLCGLVGVQHGLAISSRSGLLWGATGLLGLTAVVNCLASILVSESSIQQRVDSLSRFLTDIQAIQPSGHRRLGLGLVALGCGLFVLNSAWVLDHQDPPDDDDQMAYLITAQEIHETGGIPRLWRDLWSGRFEESNRHPLPLALQSLHPTVEFARLVGCLSAAGLMGLVLILVWRRFGPLTAGLLAILLGSNGAWVYHTPRFVCECQLAGISGLVWLELARRGELPGRGRWLLLGGLIGLAWLTKGTGLLLLAAVLVSLLWLGISEVPTRRKRVLGLAAVLVAFVIVAAPLLVRNSIRFGSPTYNVNSYLLWVDTYESPNALAEKMTLSEARTAYLQSHSVADLIRREVTGLAWEAFIGLRTLGPAPWDDARVLGGLPLLAFGLLGVSAATREAALSLVLWTGITWIVMAWYIPIAAGDRFMMPLLIPWLTLAADGLVRWAATRQEFDDAIRRLVIATVIGGVVSTVLVWSRTSLWEG
jgi:hypothetical protein